MKNPIATISEATKEVLRSGKYLRLFGVIFLALVTIIILIPTLTIPENDLLFQLSIFTVKDWFLTVLLSILVGLMITLQVYSYRKQRSLHIGNSIAGSSSGIIASLFGTAGCSSCLAGIFGFLGAGNVFFLLEYQAYVVAVSMVLILASLYFAARKINCNGACK